MKKTNLELRNELLLTAFALLVPFAGISSIFSL